MNPAPEASARTEIASAAAAAVARQSYGKLIAFLAARTRDVAAAEDALAEAFAAALADWSSNGVPQSPEAWLLTAARRKFVDMGRRRQTADAASGEIVRLAEERAAAGGPAEIPDERLALIFACAHPAIDPAIRAPLILQTVLGLTAEAIAPAFLTAPAAMGKRLGRAKEKIRAAGIPFRVPDRDELPARLASVLDAIYAAFGTDWNDPAGNDSAGDDLAGEAVFLARLVAELMPGEAEALGLLALLLHADARRGARRSPDGRYVPLSAQDPGLWDLARIAEAESVLRRASGLGAIGRYQIEAALQSAHVDRVRSGAGNWPAVVQLYDALALLAPSPVVAINRALALAERDGAAAGLAALGEIAADRRIAEYQPYHAARAEHLSRAGQAEAARGAYDRAIGLERDPAVRAYLRQRRMALPA